MPSIAIDHVEAMKQTMWNADEALAWAKGYYRIYGHWPARRFRVVTLYAGRSRLVTWPTAERLRALYGGHVEQLIPTRSAYLASLGIKRWSLHCASAEDLPACPKCHAAAGIACHTPSGSRRAPHVARCRLDDFERMAAGLDACEHCGADAEHACVRAGKPRAPHARRSRIADLVSEEKLVIERELSS